MAFTDHESVKSHYQWLSQLDVDHVPQQKNYRRTSIICTIGMFFFLYTFSLARCSYWMKANQISK